MGIPNEKPLLRYVVQRPPGPVAVKNLMLVDADSEIKSMVLRMLGGGNWAVHSAPNNAAVLDLARARLFDVILTSEKTSGLADVALLAEIRASHPHIRLIILTNESTPRDVIAAMRNHAFSYFSRPFSLEELESIIRHAIEEPCWDDGIEVIAATPEWIHLTARCDLPTADRLAQFLNEVAELPDPERTHVATAFRELLLNAIEHGAAFDPTKDVDIEYFRARRMVMCRISDPGPGFTLDEIPHAAVANPTDDPLRHILIREENGIRPGGYGVLMAQQFLDQVLYGEQGNEVVLIKYLDLDSDVRRKDEHD
jgi:anti-sigma regulatory factor (Ser/Thr protein kinase)/ActR/RegA family two-component response regulator